VAACHPVAPPPVSHPFRRPTAVLERGGFDRRHLGHARGHAAAQGRARTCGAATDGHHAVAGRRRHPPGGPRSM
ncbi:MAG: hypothetical protein AVDCRST_MAG77-1439, partial [uncultured Chloroflexi bacterium]